MKILSRIPVGLLMGIALVGFTASPARANPETVTPTTIPGVTTNTGIESILAPAQDSQSTSDPESDTTAFIWSEMTRLVLTTSVKVDMTTAGTSDSADSFKPSAGTIAAGATVDSYLIHSDPVDNGKTFTASVTFDAPILGIIDTTSGLFATDSQLGGNTDYGTNGGGTHRGLEGTDSLVWISNDGLTINFRTGAYIDEFRVITADPVPEPAPVIYCATCAATFLAFGWARRGRVRSSPAAA